MRRLVASIFHRVQALAVIVPLLLLLPPATQASTLVSSSDWTPLPHAGAPGGAAGAAGAAPQSDSPQSRRSQGEPPASPAVASTPKTPSTLAGTEPHSGPIEMKMSRRY